MVGALTEGHYALAYDPYVAVTLKKERRFDVRGAEANTDEFGMRVRTGAPPDPGAPRVVLLGDSVAFGHGVRDEEAIGNRLEDYLGRMTPSGAPRPVVFTVACPGWSTRSACRYLTSHLARIDPTSCCTCRSRTTCTTPSVRTRWGSASRSIRCGAGVCRTSPSTSGTC